MTIQPEFNAARRVPERQAIEQRLSAARARLQTQMGILGQVARTAVVAGTWTAVSNGVSRRQAGRWAAQDQSKAPAYMPPPPGRYQRPMFQQHARAAYPTPAPNPTAAPPPTAGPTYVVAAPGPAPDPMSVRLAHLKQLGELKAQGVLTEEEFQAQKSAILSG